ncbi:MAG: CHAT domain-containing protein [Lewinellaceae bacterium]|nr:CHAT domain-containing protein [Lewinellaceae bacterium]
MLTKIQFFTAEPSDACKLKLAEEHDLIIKKLARHSKKFQFFSRMATTPSDIPEAIFDSNPDIVHFSGHGSTKGEICVIDDNGFSTPIPVRALDRLFKLISNKISCVVLNACYSKIQAEKISEHVDFVIGMSNQISDRAAIAFSEGFYGAIASGEVIENAFEYGLLQLDLFDLPEENIPILLTRNKSGKIEKKEQEQEFPEDKALRENILLILTQTKLEVRGTQSFGMGGIGFGAKLHDEGIDDALIKLKKL